MIQTDTLSSTEKKRLPDGWRWSELKEIARVFAGSSAPQGKEYFDPAGPPFIRVSDLSNKKRTTCLLEVADHLSNKALKECSLVLAKSGSTLFPKSGAAILANNRALLGMDAHIVSHLMVVEPIDKVVDPLWIYWAICQINMLDYSDNPSYPSLKQSTAEKIIIPLPPLQEQNRIIDIITEKVSAIEKAKVAAEVQLNAAEALPKACLRETFSGPMAKGWAKRRLGDVCDFIGGMQPPKGVFKYKPQDGYVRLVQIQDFRRSDMAVYIPIEDTKRMFDETDVMIGRYGPPIFQILRGLSGSYNVALIKTMPKEGLNKGYLYYFLQEPNIQRAVIAQSQRSAGQSGVQKEFLENCFIPLPSLLEQQKVVQDLDNKFKAFVKLQNKLIEENNIVKHLVNASLRKAFNGEL